MLCYDLWITKIKILKRSFIDIEDGAEESFVSCSVFHGLWSAGNKIHYICKAS